MIFGTYFTSGVYFYPQAKMFFWYCVPSAISCLFVLFGIKQYISIISDPDEKHFYMVSLRRPYDKFPCLWPLYLVSLVIFRSVVFSLLGAFFLWSNWKLISKVVAYGSMESIVELKYVGVNNYRRKNMLDIQFRELTQIAATGADIHRDFIDYKNYSNIEQSIDVSELICIKGRKLPWGGVVTQVSNQEKCDK
jgi:hypothetical protein